MPRPGVPLQLGAREERPNPARWSRAPSVARPSETSARGPPRHPERRRLPSPSVQQSPCERLRSLPGYLFLARAENAVRGRGTARAAPASWAAGHRASSAAPARALPEPPGAPRREPQRGHPLRECHLPDATGGGQGTRPLCPAQASDAFLGSGGGREPSPPKAS